jgi:hypothetical protein
MQLVFKVKNRAGEIVATKSLTLGPTPINTDSTAGNRVDGKAKSLMAKSSVSRRCRIRLLCSGFGIYINPIQIDRSLFYNPL